MNWVVLRVISCTYSTMVKAVSPLTNSKIQKANTVLDNPVIVGRVGGLNVSSVSIL